MLRERKSSKSKSHGSSKSAKYRASNPNNQRLTPKSYNGLICALFCVGILAIICFVVLQSLKVSPPPPHDLLIIINENGNIYTMDENMPTCTAICVDATTGKFIYISQNKDKLWSKCLEIPHKTVRAINASQYTILPGLIDTHAHIMMRGALLFDTIDISQATSFKNMMRTIKDFIAKKNLKKGTWVKAMGYDENKWYDWYDKKEQPTRFHIDKYISDYKVALYRTDLHAVLINTLGLDSIQHTFPSNTDNISGGKVIKNDKGQLTGLFIDNARRLVLKYIHPYYGDQNDKHKYRKYVKMATGVIRECNKYGLTAVHDMDEQKDIIENVYKWIIDNNLRAFNVRLSVYVHGSSDNDDENFRSALLDPTDYNKYFMYGDRLSVSGVKLFLDGALGSWGAKLIDPYCDRADSDGIWIYKNTNDYYNDIKKWYQAGWQISTHAIGDKANRVALQMYQKLITEYQIDNKNVKDMRLRIEHAQIVEPIHDLPQFGALFIVANMQPTHATSDLGFAENRLKCRNKNQHDRMLGAYAWKSMLKYNVKLTFGSDFPAVGQVNPFLGIYAAVTRQTEIGYPSDPDGWYANERVSILEALRAYTIDAAYASFQEEFIGSITPNKLADFIFIDRDLFQFHGEGPDGVLSDDPKGLPRNHPRHILNTNVAATFFGGRMVFHNRSFPIQYMPTQSL